MSGQICMAKEGKYLTFSLGDQDYDVEILKVREIIGMLNITIVPKVPAYVKGVINLRGKVIPVIDLRLKFGMPTRDVTSETCIIIINMNDALMGIMVDSVKEVLNLKQENIENVPNFGTHVHTDYILGIGKINDSVKILLHIEKILGEDLTMTG